MSSVELSCNCNKVKGVALDVSAETGTRIVCYCADCQAFANNLECEEQILDEHGGTDIFQMTPKQLRITQGADLLRCMRLSPKGLYRWYTECCNTPVANTVSATIPFIGLIRNFIAEPEKLDDTLGPVHFYIQGKDALGSPPNPKLHQGVPAKMLIRIIPKLLMAKVSGKARPNPLFSENGKAISKPHICSNNQQ
jgi:hypothetical protein